MENIEDLDQLLSARRREAAAKQAPPRVKLTQDLVEWLYAHPEELEYIKCLADGEKERLAEKLIIEDENYFEEFDELYKRVFGRRPSYKVWKQKRTVTDKTGKTTEVIVFMAEISYNVCILETVESGPDAGGRFIKRDADGKPIKEKKTERGFGRTEAEAKSGVAAKAYYMLKPTLKEKTAEEMATEEKWLANDRWEQVKRL